MRCAIVTFQRNFLNYLCSRRLSDIEDQSYVGLNPSRSGYYRLVYQSRRFIKENWGKLFAIQRVIPCYFQHSDLVIARK